MAIQTPYLGELKNWQDVQREFSTQVSEPDEVLMAAYEYENYSGDAVVIYRQGDLYFDQEGSHCSCYGLEGQWVDDMQGLPLPEFIEFLKKKLYYTWGGWVKEVIKELEARHAA